MKHRRQGGHVLHILAHLHSTATLINKDDGKSQVFKSINQNMFSADATFPFPNYTTNLHCCLLPTSCVPL